MVFGKMFWSRFLLLVICIHSELGCVVLLWFGACLVVLGCDCFFVGCLWLLWVLLCCVWFVFNRFWLFWIIWPCFFCLMWSWFPMFQSFSLPELLCFSYCLSSFWLCRVVLSCFKLFLDVPVYFQTAPGCFKDFVKPILVELVEVLANCVT